MEELPKLWVGGVVTEGPDGNAGKIKLVDKIVF